VPVDGRDARLPLFARGDAGDRFPAGWWLAMMLDELSGPDRRCPAATDDELIGMLGRWAAVESWAAAGKLGLLAELARRRAKPGHEHRRPADLPGALEEGTGHEVAGALSVSLPGADRLIELACTLQARLPRTWALLTAGVIDDLKARIVADELAVLDDGLAAQAEALIADQMAGKTPSQVAKLAAAAVVAVDPAGATRRRKQAPLTPPWPRDLANAAARSPHSSWCITVVSPEGYAIGHGCARPVKGKRGKPPPGRSRGSPWAFTPRDDPGPPGGWGTWTLTLPGGRDYTVKLGPIPVTDCDHRHESHGYQPSDLLKHLVQVRDGTCTFPCCSRHAKETDFEHALPYDQGGRTCACNAGARSRRCHKVKQSRDWTVTQPLPGWHRWQTPSGRIYTQEPAKYPV
jgi:hypothetical protein